jgi:hypothetical protein
MPDPLAGKPLPSPFLSSVAATRSTGSSATVERCSRRCGFRRSPSARSWRSSSPCSASPARASSTARGRRRAKRLARVPRFPKFGSRSRMGLAKKFTEPVALLSTRPADLPLPRTASGLSFDLLALRARCVEEAMGRAGCGQAGDSPDSRSLRHSSHPRGGEHRSRRVTGAALASDAATLIGWPTRSVRGSSPEVPVEPDTTVRDSGPSCDIGWQVFLVWIGGCDSPEHGRRASVAAGHC